jgi:hypothetical protein
VKYTYEASDERFVIRKFDCLTYISTGLHVNVPSNQEIKLVKEAS